MSAFIVSHKHINTLVSYGRSPRMSLKLKLNDGTYLDFDNEADLQRAACILLYQNERSVNQRYPDTIDNPDDMPGPVAEVNTPIRFRYENNRSPVQILKACQCYDYQACETEGYEQTDAQRITRAIAAHAINNLDGYDKAEWSID